MVVERADFDDLVTLVSQAPTWEKDRLAGVRTLLRAIGDSKANAPDQILARWTWKLARTGRTAQDRRASAEFPEAKRLLGALANSRGHRHEENAARLVNAALELPLEVGVALLASAEGYTARATQLIEAARERLGEIEAAGGSGMANTDSITNYDAVGAMVQKAIDEWGKLDIVVNVAGILRDRMIFNMAEEEWDAVIDVHLNGTFNTCRHASAHFRERREGGRIINFSSTSAWGSPGQPNYAAAKAGITALTLATAQSCHRYGVTANAICPRARTAMTETMGLDPEQFASENVSPLVAVLAGEGASNISGQVFVVYGGYVDVFAAPKLDRRFETQGRWDTEALAAVLGGFYAGRAPVTDGFAVPFA